MAGCKTCSSKDRAEAERRAKSGTPHALVALWMSSRGEPISRLALGRHLRHHAAVVGTPAGRRPVSGDFLSLIRDTVQSSVEAGEQVPSVRDGISAAAAIEARISRGEDRNLLLTLAQVLGGGNVLPALPANVVDGEYVELDPEAAEDEALFARLAGDEPARLTPYATEERKDAIRSHTRG